MSVKQDNDKVKFLFKINHSGGCEEKITGRSNEAADLRNTQETTKQ